MKRALKWTLRVLLGLVALVVLLLLVKDSIIRIWAEHRILAETGMKARIGRISTSLRSPVVTIKDFRLYNTPEFGDTLFLDIPELHIEIDPASLAENKFHVNLIRLDLAELDVVRNRSGQTNIFVILNEARRREKERGFLRAFRNYEFTGVDELKLSLGKLNYLDLADPANNHETDLNLTNLVFKDLKSEGDVYGMMAMLWLRSGGKLALTPTEFSGSPAGKRATRPKSRISEAKGEKVSPLQNRLSGQGSSK